MKTNKIILKNGRRPLVSLLALFLLSATFFPAIEALASPTGFDVLTAEFVKGDGEYNLNITLERTKQTAVSIVGTLRFTEDYTEENLTLVDPEQSWGTMVKDEIKSIIYNLSTVGDLTYPEGFLLEMVYTVNGQPKAETLTLTATWGSGEFQPEIILVPFILDFDAYGTNKGSGTVLKT